MRPHGSEDPGLRIRLPGLDYVHVSIGSANIDHFRSTVEKELVLHILIRKPMESRISSIDRQREFSFGGEEIFARRSRLGVFVEDVTRAPAQGRCENSQKFVFHSHLIFRLEGKLNTAQPRFGQRIDVGCARPHLRVPAFG